MSNKNDVREIHGDEFAEGLDEQFELNESETGEDSYEDGEFPEEGQQVYQPSLRYRVTSKLLEIFQSRMAFWLAGFVDGIIVGLIIAYFRSR